MAGYLASDQNDLGQSHACTDQCLSPTTPKMCPRCLDVRSPRVETKHTDVQVRRVQSVLDHDEESIRTGSLLHTRPRTLLLPLPPHVPSSTGAVALPLVHVTCLAPKATLKQAALTSLATMAFCAQ
jgi:hypothetical protein